MPDKPQIKIDSTISIQCGLRYYQVIVDIKANHIGLKYIGYNSNGKFECLLHNKLSDMIDTLNTMIDKKLLEPGKPKIENDEIF